MKIGWIGLGKLGLPAAAGINSKGHEVNGFDINPDIKGFLKAKTVPYKEEGLPELLESHEIEFRSVEEIVEWADIIFAAPQTPHDSRYEGSTPIPDTRADFDYKYLKELVLSVSTLAKANKRRITLVVISTCLPGTYTREIQPILNKYVNYVYNPWFIAMGTVLKDLFDPEFVLVGNNNSDISQLKEFYQTIHDKELLVTDITTAEAIKVSYNTFITTKTVLANLWGEIAHKTGANVDDIYKAWTMATDRLVSSKYLKSGMGDGGGCHPRDNIALSYIADKLDLSFNYFEALMKAREKHCEWQADLIIEAIDKYNLPVVILGKSFKPETNIVTGSPAMLLSNLLSLRNAPHIHVGEDEEQNLHGQAIYFIATQHNLYSKLEFPEGSVVIDPFGYIEDKFGIKVMRIGRK